MSVLSRLRRLATAVLAVALALPCVAYAQPSQTPAAMQAVAEHFLRARATGLPGEIAVDVAPPRAALPACDALEAFQNPGARSSGRVTVGVRCLAPQTWTAYLSARVRVVGRYVALRQALPAQHALEAADLEMREGDLGTLPSDVVVEAAGLVGYRTVSALAAGAPLRQSVLRAPLAVQQGQVTRLILNGPGFTVTSEGQALANAGRGETVRVRTASGQVVSGRAEDGQQVVVAY